MSWKETDPLSLWKNATVVPRSSEHDALYEKTDIGKRLDSSRSKLWAQLTLMSPQHREEYLGKLVHSWPYQWEKKAVKLPATVSMTVSSLSACFLATKVCADVILYEPKLRFMQVVRQSPKTPIMFATWTAGLTSLMLNQSFNYQPLLTNEEKPCVPCVYGKSIAFGILSGLVMPVITVPYSVEYVQMKMQQQRPAKESLYDSFVLVYEYSRNAWRHLPAMFGVHVVFGSLTAYAFLWGRHRIFETVDMDPEFIRECIRKADSAPPSIFSWARNTVKRFSISSLFAPKGDSDG